MSPLSVVRFAFVLSASLPHIACLLTSNVTTSVASSARLKLTETSSGLAAAEECWASWDVFSSYLTTCAKTIIPGPTTTRAGTWTSIVYKTYELCDGHPRAIATGGERTWVSTATWANGSAWTTFYETLPPSGIPLSTATVTHTSTRVFDTTTCASPLPTPQCSIDDSNCLALASAWTAGGFSRNKPPCSVGSSIDPCDYCQIFISSIKLIYFPVTMAGDFCGNCTLHSLTSFLADVDLFIF